MSSGQGTIKRFLSEGRSLLRRRALPSDLKSRALSRLQKTRSVFVHVPKCGGKTVINDLYNLQAHEGFGHAGIAFYQAILGPKRFEDFFKFAIVRDPLDRCRSGFYFLKSGGFGTQDDLAVADTFKDHSFASFVLDGQLERMTDEHIIFKPQTNFITDVQGEIAVDRILRFQNFEAEFQQVLKDLGQPNTVSHLNKTKGSKMTRPDEDVCQKLKVVYAKDYEKLGDYF